MSASQRLAQTFDHVEELEEYRRQNPTSLGRFEAAKAIIPGGNTRLTAYFAPYPFYAVSGQGCRMYDLDGNVRLDFYNNATSLIFGHAYPPVVEAISDQARKGTAFAIPTEPEVELAQLLAGRIPSVEQIRFTNSGTEAVMFAIRAARVFTGREKIAKFEGGYHGTSDAVSISVTPDLALSGDASQPLPVPASAGITHTTIDDVIILPFNDLEATTTLIAAHKDELAAVIVEPILGSCGYVPAKPEFLQGLRVLTKRLGMLLIFDEVQTFRLSAGGAQGLLDIMPDLTVLGKIIGGGLPVGGLGGRSEVMAAFDATTGTPKIPHAGTFNGNPVTMRAGLATLQDLSPAAYDRLNLMGSDFRRRLQTLCDRYKVPVQVTGDGSLFGIHWGPEPVSDYRSSARTNKSLSYKFFLYALNNGIFFTSRGGGCLSMPMTDTELGAFLDVLEGFLQNITT
ncbi:MAG TPA: aspartate aminotransferase family protein [Candidatus Tectomicrobia bacterium]|nr:aspartate aminotransferase family protein [Candidatus Tectomicrobia bacterium]